MSQAVTPLPRAPVPDVLSLTVDGRTYAGWTDIRVSRGLDRCATDFDISVSERWGATDLAWPIKPYSECVIAIGADPIMTGYVDAYEPSLDGTSHQVRVRGRSRTQDLIDCTPDIKSGQFAGYTLEAIARSICGLFNIGVSVETDGASTVVADAKLERSETAWTFLERLCRLAAVLATDNAKGELVLTRAGATRAAGRLVQGQNILRAQSLINVSKRFSDYIVKGQHGVGGAAGGGLDLSALAGPGPANYSGKSGGTVQTGQAATAHDKGVPRYRPHVTIAESQLPQGGMQLRANWQRAYAYGRAVRVRVDVPSWRQPDGSLWTLNQIVPLTSSYLGIDMDLLVSQVEYNLDDRGGLVTRLQLGPIEAFTPDPGQVKAEKVPKHKGGHIINLDGLAPG